MRPSPLRRGCWVHGAVVISVAVLYAPLRPFLAAMGWRSGELCIEQLSSQYSDKLG